MIEDLSIIGGESMEPQLIVDQVSKQWENMVSNPGLLTDLSEQKIVFAAGGGLVTQFGNSESGIWSAIEESAVDGEITIAGIEFKVDDLEKMGDYYRFLKEKGYNFHCIDERLEGDEDHLKDEVHCKCGACAAVGAATNLKDVEDALLTELGQKVKQEVYEDMPDHESMTILVDLHGSDVVLGDKRVELKDKKALPFNASLSLENIMEWSKNGNDKHVNDLISTLVKWNVQIARNIIGGDHNTLQESAENTIVVVDSRGVDTHPLYEEVMENINMVNHGKIMAIAG